MGNTRLIIANIGFIFISILMILPNMSSDIKNYQAITKTIKHIEFNKKVTFTYTDKSTCNIGDNYSDFWSQLKRDSNIGKQMRLYIRRGSSSLNNPVQVEIGGVIVYDVRKGNFYNYLFLLMTLGLTIYHLLKMGKRLTP